MLKHILDIACAYVNALPGFTACGDGGLFAEGKGVKDMAIFGENGCVFLFPKSDDIIRGFP